MKIDVCPAETILGRSIPLKQTDRTSWTIQSHSDELNWARRPTFHELNSLCLDHLKQKVDVWPKQGRTSYAPINCIVRGSFMTRLMHHFSYFPSFPVISTDHSLDFKTFLNSVSNEVLFSKYQLSPAICPASTGFSKPVGRYSETIAGTLLVIIITFLYAYSSMNELFKTKQR